MTIDEIIEIAKQYGWVETDNWEAGDNYVAVCSYPTETLNTIPFVYVTDKLDTDEWIAVIGYHDDWRIWCSTPSELHSAFTQVIADYITYPSIRRGIARYLRTTLAPQSHLAIEVGGQHRLFSVDDLCKALEG
jgi:hypothetical protein